MDNIAFTLAHTWPTFLLIAVVCGLSYIAYTALTWWESRADERFMRRVADGAERARSGQW